ncbi:hypothetical protein M9Y10_009350 [Tritrichomonas musculus]|uniref:Uncharacterized protein n=1 Tax=Tritrichomonas musculus TaxID=1915356 RepID=A0ABR2IP01_9EUKA
MIFFYFISLTLSDPIGKCGTLFQDNFRLCSQDNAFKNTDESSNEGYSIRSECATMAPFAMPVGWKDYKSKDIKYAYFTTHDPHILPSKSKLEDSDFSKTSPLPIDDVTKEGNHKKFHKWCPMYDYNLRPDDKQFHNRQTCCNHANTQVFKTQNIDATYVAGNFEIFQKHNLYQVYPKCYDLLRYMPCMVCDPRVQEKDYIFQVGYKVPDGYTTEIPVYTYRLCDYYATEIWNQCRRAFFLTNGRKLVVPKNMGLEQFKNMVGVPSLHGLGNDKCFNISDVNPFYEV